MLANDLFEYDVFVSYAKAEREWVERYLLPRLQKADLKTTYDAEFILGSYQINNIQQAILQSRHTVIVMTPAWLDSEWNAFEGALAQTLDPAAVRRKLIPVLLQPCEVPDRIEALTGADLRNQRNWEREIRRLIYAIQWTQPVLPPWKTSEGIKNGKRWRTWLWRYRWQVSWQLVSVCLLWMTLFTFLKWPPFQDRRVWVPEFTFPEQQQFTLLPNKPPRILYNTGNALVVGRYNFEQSCQLSNKGLWVRSLKGGDQWMQSEVGDLLCIPKWSGGKPALSDIRAIVASPAHPQTVYVLTSHTGLLVSINSGVTFQQLLASNDMSELITSDNATALLALGEASSEFWVAGSNYGLWRYQDRRWVRLDDTSKDACQGLRPNLTVTALLLLDHLVLIGTEKAGLWISNDHGKTCRLVFDANGEYIFREIGDVSQPDAQRFLAFVEDVKTNKGTGVGVRQLLDICPHAQMCTAAQWQSEGIPIWDTDTPVDDLHIQKNGTGHYEWYLASQSGEVWHGVVDSNRVETLPTSYRCFPFCRLSFAYAGPDLPPYLMVDNRVYEFTYGAWWRRIWS